MRLLSSLHPGIWVLSHICTANARPSEEGALVRLCSHTRISSEQWHACKGVHRPFVRTHTQTHTSSLRL